jgi:hypothetical protein
MAEASIDIRKPLQYREKKGRKKISASGVSIAKISAVSLSLSLCVSCGLTSSTLMVEVSVQFRGTFVAG